LSFLHETKDGILMEVRVQPKAGRNELAGVQDGRLKIRLTAAPVEGEANRECMKFLAKLLDIPKSDLEIIKGQKSRLKTILVRKRNVDGLLRILQEQGLS
jgi:uncharacterized protein